MAEYADKQDAGEQGPAEDEHDESALPEAELPAAFEGETMNRRRAFSVAAQGVGGVAGAAIVLPALGFALAPVFERQDESWVSVGRPGEFTPDTYKSRVITIVADIGEAGKTTVYVRQGNPLLSEESADSYIEESENADSFVSISTRCMHLDGQVRYVNAAVNSIRQCHSCVSDFQRAVSGCPPVRPIDRHRRRLVVVSDRYDRGAIAESRGRDQFLLPERKFRVARQQVPAFAELEIRRPVDFV